MFSKKDNTRQQMRSNDRELNKAVRELQRDKGANEREQKKLELEIKQAVKANNKKLAGILAKQLIQLRKANESNLSAQARIKGVQMQQKSMAANQTVANSMAKTTKVMAKTAPDVRQTAKTMNEFARENEKMAVMDEMMEDAMAGAFSDDDEAEDDVIGQVLAEIGVDINAQLAQTKAAKDLPTTSSEADDDLLRRLNQLAAPPQS